MMHSVAAIKLYFKLHSTSINVMFVSLIVFLCVAIYLAGSWGATTASAIQPRQLMVKWADNKIPFSPKKWQLALRKLHAAVENNPNNAQHYFDLARLYEWSAYQKPIWVDEAIINRTKAVEYYKKSLEHRPTWSSAWVNLAMSKTLNLEFGEEVLSALSNAMVYGVWEKGVFHKVLWISLANWKGLPLTLQEQVKARVKETINAKGQVPKYVEQTAVHFQWQDELEQLLSQESNPPF